MIYALLSHFAVLGSSPSSRPKRADAVQLVLSANFGTTKYNLYELSRSAYRVRPSSISDSADVVGTTEKESDPDLSAPAIWSHGGIRVLTIGSDTGGASAISKNGSYIVGNAIITSGGAVERGILWQVRGSSTSQPYFIGTHDSENKSALGVNNSGDIVGTSSGGHGGMHAYLWLSLGRRSVDLGTLGGYESCATSINNQGVIVGWSLNKEAKDHAFVYRNGHMDDLGTLPGLDESEATSIDDAGNLVGHSGNHPVEWPLLGGVKELPDYGYKALPMCISGNYIVGYCKTKAGSNDAVLWKNGMLEDLNSLTGKRSSEIHLTFATSVNGHGDITGYMSFNGEKVGFLLQRQ